MTSETFLEKESRILSDIATRGLSSRDKCLVTATPRSPKVQAGYFALLRPSADVRCCVEYFSQGVRDALGDRVISYHNQGFGTVHTTVATQGIREFDDSNDAFNPDNGLLDVMADSLSASISKVSSPLILGYSGFINDPSTVLLRPTGDAETYLSLQRTFIEEAESRGLSLKPSWGRHTTVSRFTEDIPASEAQGFFGLMDSSASRQRSSLSTPAEDISVGHFRWSSDDGFLIFPYRTFVLPQAA